MNIAICDDQKESVLTLYKFIDKILNNGTADIHTISKYFDGMSLLKDIRSKKKFDVIFLDIEMPDISGMEVARVIRENDSDVMIIFVTSHPNFMPASFKVEAFDFLTKPVTERDLSDVLNRCIKKYRQKNGQIKINTSLGLAVIHLNDIVYISSDRHYIDFHTVNNTTIHTKMTLDQLAKEIKTYTQFARCHKSFMVNLDYAAEVQRLQIILKPVFPGIRPIPVSRTYKDSIKEAFLIHHLKL